MLYFSINKKQLLLVNDNCIDDEEVSTSIEKNDLNVLINYINVWNQKYVLLFKLNLCYLFETKRLCFRHCFCFLKDHLNLLHFNNLVQSIITTSFNLLKEILNSIQEIDIETIHIGQFDDWTNEDKEKLFQLKAKVFFHRFFVVNFKCLPNIFYFYNRFISFPFHCMLHINIRLLIRMRNYLPATKETLLNIVICPSMICQAFSFGRSSISSNQMA